MKTIDIIKDVVKDHGDDFWTKKDQEGNDNLWIVDELIELVKRTGQTILIVDDECIHDLVQACKALKNVFPKDLTPEEDQEIGRTEGVGEQERELLLDLSDRS